jgi:hypothetical protein
LKDSMVLVEVGPHFGKNESSIWSTVLIFVHLVHL